MNKFTGVIDIEVYAKIRAALLRHLVPCRLKSKFDYFGGSRDAEELVKMRLALVVSSILKFPNALEFVFGHLHWGLLDGTTDSTNI